MTNRYLQEYEEKKRTFPEILDAIEDGDSIATTFAAMEPIGILSNLHKIYDRINRVDVGLVLSVAKYKFFDDPEYNDKFNTSSWFMLEPNRKGFKEGNIDYVPANLHEGACKQIDVDPSNVLIATTTPMDEHGYFRTSLCNICVREWLDVVDKVILEVVPEVPTVYGDNEIHISQVDHLYEFKRPIPQIEKPPITDVERKIGQHVATLVNDGDTIQLGIGAIPDAVAEAFMDKKDLGIHTEMITNSVVDLVENGVVTGRKKNLHKGKIVGTFALGNQRLYDFLNHNPGVLMLPGNYVNDPWVVAKNDNMVSINTAISVDLTGQVASESIGYKQYSGTGGQSDMAIGATHSKGGRSIIAIRSTAKNGTISTIQTFLDEGAIVTLSRNNIDYVVTEYGIAPLKGRCVRERAINLISVAHPKFRDQLTEDANRLYSIDAKKLSSVL